MARERPPSKLLFFLPPVSICMATRFPSARLTWLLLFWLSLLLLLFLLLLSLLAMTLRGRMESFGRLQQSQVHNIEKGTS